jgi:hypothetical protein
MVKRFRTKPVEIKAIQWTGDNLKDVQDFVGSRKVDENWTIINFQLAGTYGLWIHDDGSAMREITGEVFDTLHHSWIGVKTGQWIVRGVKGEVYPCDDETFHWKYEEVITENQYANGHPYDRT